MALYIVPLRLKNLLTHSLTRPDFVIFQLTAISVTVNLNHIASDLCIGRSVGWNPLPNPRCSSQF